jgi:CheY-like chemotaxis protein
MLPHDGHGGEVDPTVLAGGRTLLLVEDDADIRDVLANALARSGYRVLVAGNGREAIERLAAAADTPDLILLDWMMPVMSGLEFISYQATDPSLRDVPVIVLSAVDRVYDIAGAGIAVTMVKPVRLRTLVDVVDRLCGMSRADAGLAAISGRVPAPRLAPAPPPPRAAARTMRIRRRRTDSAGS